MPDEKRRSIHPHLSIVIPLFNERATLEELHERLTAVLGAIGLPYEIVFVDDGSVDGTYRELRGIAAVDPGVRLVKLTRNSPAVRTLLRRRKELGPIATLRLNRLVMMDEEYHTHPRRRRRERAALGGSLPSRTCAHHLAGLDSARP